MDWSNFVDIHTKHATFKNYIFPEHEINKWSISRYRFCLQWKITLYLKLNLFQSLRSYLMFLKKFGWSCFIIFKCFLLLGIYIIMESVYNIYVHVSRLLFSFVNLKISKRLKKQNLAFAVFIYWNMDNLRENCSVKLLHT